MDDGLKDFIQELRDYGNARRGDLAGMILEAANRLEYMSMQLRMADPACKDYKPRKEDIRMQWVSTKDRLPDTTQPVAVTIRRFLWDDDIYSGEYEDWVGVALFEKQRQGGKPFDVPYEFFKDGDIFDQPLLYGCHEKRLQTGYINNEPIYADGPEDYVIAWAPLPDAYQEEVADGLNGN